jgi:adenosylcobinamide-GDP ribazoletransferase
MRRALAFLTPFGHAAIPNPRTLDWFPFAGAAIGLTVGGAWWAAGKAWAPIVAAAIAVASDVVLTGYLHLDGLADAADGLLPPMDRARRLEVMRDPSVGAFGAVTVVTVLLLRFVAFAAAPAEPLVVAALWCGSRTAMVVIARTLPYVQKDGGLVTAFMGRADIEGPPSRPGSGWTIGGVIALAVGLALAVALGFFGRGLHGLAAVGAGALGAIVVAIFARSRIGGFTGDVLGASGVVSETVGLLVLAAK